jgi:hypothetical protein
MHTSHALSTDDFQITVGGRPGSLAEVMPGLDRLGIVIAEPGGAAGCSTLILAAVTAFYDQLRAVGQDFFAYPDFFALHVGADQGTLHMIDVYPDHKEPVIPADGESILQAINDRAITHLLVPEGPTADPDAAFQRETAHSARRRVRTALAYARNGSVSGADVEIAAGPGEEFVTAMLGSPRAITRETLRRVPVEQALGMVAALPG